MALRRDAVTLSSTVNRNPGAVLSTTRTAEGDLVLRLDKRRRRRHKLLYYMMWATPHRYVLSAKVYLLYYSASLKLGAQSSHSNHWSVGGIFSLSGPVKKYESESHSRIPPPGYIPPASSLRVKRIPGKV